jgi:DNA-binding CsgD family transcriptional regulator
MTGAGDGGIRELTDIQQMSRLVGRASELAQLEAFIAAAADGVGSVVLIIGEPGIGKTSLLTAAAQFAAKLGLEIRRTTASSAEIARPFSLIRPLLDVGSAAQGLTVEAVTDQIETFVSAPALVAVDDLQWGDEASLHVLAALARRIPSQPAVLLLSTRAPEADSRHEAVVATLSREGAVAVRIGPLERDAVALFAADRIGAAPSPRLAATLDRAAGNPFYLGVLLDHVRASPSEEGPTDATAALLAPSLREAVLSAMTAWGAGGRELLRLASVLGPSFSLNDVACLAGRDPLEAWPDIARALGIGILEEIGDLLRFRHDLVREAVYAEIPGALRAELHRRAAEVLAGNGADASVVAAQLLWSPRRRDPWALAWLRRGAREVSSAAPATSIGLLRRALDLCEQDEVAREEVAAELAVNLVWSARFADADLVIAGLDTNGVTGATRARLLLALGWARWIEGQTIESARVFRRGADDAELPESDRRRLAGFAAWVTGFQLGRFREARDLAARAVATGNSGTDDVARFMGLATHAGIRYLEGHPQEAAEEARVLADDVRRSADPELGQVGADILWTLASVDADRIDDADAASAAGAEVSRRSGSASVAALWHRTRALRHFAVGAWDDALAELAGLRILAADTGRHLGSAVGDALQVMILVHRGQVEEATAVLGGVEDRDPEYRGHWLAWARALVLDASGDREGAVEALSSVWSQCELAGFAVDLPWIGPDLVRMALATDRADLAADVVGGLERLPTGGPPSFGAARLWCRGLVQRDASALLEAADAYEPGRRQFAGAVARLDAGEILIEGGRRPEAIPHIERALQSLQDLRAVEAMARAQRLLGAPRSRRSRAPRPTTGWESLTATEKKVAALVVDGLSNSEIAARLFVSRRTIESHMARVLMKLQVRSRVQVVKALLESGALDAEDRTP